MATTYYLPSEEGWQSSGASTAYFLRLKVDRTYNVVTNESTYTVSLQAKGSANVYGGSYTVLADGTVGGGGNTLYTFVTPDANRAHKVTIDSAGTWYDVRSAYNANSWSFNVTHADDGSSTVSFGVNLRLYYYLSGNAYYGTFSNQTASLTVNEARASTIASGPSSVETNATLAISMSRASQAFYHIATFKVGNATLYTSSAFATSLSFTVPRTWFNDYGTVTSLFVSVSIQTYTDSGCGTAVGSPATGAITVTADAGMKPTLASGFASATANNTGTAASGISGYVQGYSKATVTLDASKVTHAAGATLNSYKVVCQNFTGTGTGTSYTTNVLTGTSAIAITVTVTDSRGRTASSTLSVTPMAYANPTLSSVSAFRCDSGGTADENGAYFSAKGTAGCSSLNNQNSVSLTAKYRATGGSYGTATTLTSGTASILGGALDPDTSYEVLLTATDSLGNTATATVTLSTRQWAMKFRPNGQGVAFGMAPQNAKELQLPSDWKIRIGSLLLGPTEQDTRSGLGLPFAGGMHQVMFHHSNTNADGVNLYFIGSSGVVYHLGIYVNGLALDVSDDGENWTNKWVMYP